MINCNKRARIVVKERAFEIDVLEKEATLLRLEVEQEDSNLHKIGEMGVLKIFFIHKEIQSNVYCTASRRI